MAAAASATARRRRVGATLVRRALRDARVRTIGFAYLFLIVAYVNASAYASLYPTLKSRLAFAASFGNNKAVVVFYGKAYDLLTAGGYSAWRVGGTLALFAAVFGIFAAVRALRTEEDAGRSELVLAGRVGRTVAMRSSVAAIALTICALWVGEFAGLALAGLQAGESAYLALATASVAFVFAGVGAVACQFAPSKRGAVQIGLAVFVACFLLRIAADTSHGVEWLRWLTPLGWAEDARPFTGAAPAALIAPVLATVALLLAAALAFRTRDIGSGLFAGRDFSRPHYSLLGSPTAHGLREERGSLLGWVLSLAAVGFVIGFVAKSVNRSVITPSVERELSKFGALRVASPIGYIALSFILVVPAVCAFMCAQMGAARREEEEERLETLFSMPVARLGWLGGRIALALGGAVVVALAAALATWAGAEAAGLHVALGSMLEAGANCLPAAVLFLGVAAFAYAFAPRASSAISYGLLAVAFLWYLFGSLVSVPKWIINATPFAHVGTVPVEPFRGPAALVMVALGIAATLVASVRFRRRDLIGD
ncbi:MAG TPA: hypothetical protein VMA83_05215 [Solirubrobacteraceae bacterium]|nr:hypothetical protein [Solirubrobacteraceae bacterium]